MRTQTRFRKCTEGSTLLRGLAATLGIAAATGIVAGCGSMGQSAATRTVSVLVNMPQQPLPQHKCQTISGRIICVDVEPVQTRRPEDPGDVPVDVCWTLQDGWRFADNGVAVVDGPAARRQNDVRYCTTFERRDGKLYKYWIRVVKSGEPQVNWDPFIQN